MCGILAEFNLNPDSGFNEFVNGLDVIEHRGPDGYGLYFANKEVCTTVFNFDKNELPHEDAFEVKLGHRRLAIQDLSECGAQPMQSACGRYLIVFNGEIYNKEELGEQLSNLNIGLRGDSDTEVLVNLYSVYKDKILDQLKGMFAFVIYDVKDKSFFVARDRFGIKPLYYMALDTRVVFASEIKQFTYFSGFKKKVNMDAVLDYLFLDGLTDNGRQTMFQGIQRVLPGEKICVNCDGEVLSLSGEQWYHLSEYKDNGFSFKRNRDTYLGLLRDSIDEHLLSDVPIGSSLSGGIDSSIVTALVKELEGKVKTVSAVSRYSTHSEDKFAAMMSEIVNSEHHECYVESSDLLDEVESFIYLMDEPTQSQSAFLGSKVYLRAREEGLKVMLNGQGADEYLGAYGGFEKLLAVKSPINFFKDIRLGIEGLYLTSCPVIRYLVKLFKKDTILFLQTLNWRMKFRFFCRIRVKGYKRFKSKWELSKFQLFEDALPRYLRWEDRNSMQVGVEARVPFLDHELVEYALTIPLHQHVYFGYKSILKDLSKEYLPDEIIRRPKKGYLTPEEIWLKEENTQAFIDLMEESFNYSSKIFSKKVLERFNRIAKNEEEYSRIYWRYISVGLWIKVFDLEI